MIFWLVSEARVELVRFSRKLKTSRGANFSKADTGKRFWWVGERPEAAAQFLSDYLLSG